MNRKTPALPSFADVETLLTEHLAEHRRLPESARARDLGAERALIQDYSGRVVYELLQNALDRADTRILVAWDPHARCLEVANDGCAASVYRAGEGERRSDFHALLSLHSSTKTAEESVGNKGVGFRSVFAAASEVEVWSRTAEGGWWGMRLRHPVELEPEAVVSWSSREVASFYAPQRLARHELERWGDFVTVVRLREVRPERVAVLEHSVRELMRLPMRFLAGRAKNPVALSISLHCGDTAMTHRLTSSPLEIAVSAVTTLSVPEAVRRDTGLALPQATVRVMACDLRRVSGEEGAAGTEETANARHPGLYWSYLPTEQAAGFGVNIHADFYLSNSRRALALRALGPGEDPDAELNAAHSAGCDPSRAASDPAGWNRRLVRRAAALIVRDLWRQPAMLAREDFWHYANPERCSCPHLAFEVGRLLMGEKGVFADLVAGSFDAGAVAQRQWRLQRYADLFQAVEAWANFAYQHADCAGFRRRYEWQAWLLDQVAASGAPVLPIVEQIDETRMADRVAVARALVKGVQGQSRADGDRIYLRRPRSDADGSWRLPPAAEAQGMFITVFAPPGLQDKAKHLHGVLDFSRPEVLAHLRPGRHADEHHSLLLAALKLASEEPGQGGVGSILARVLDKGVGPAWRFTPDTDRTLMNAAKAIRNLHLPTLQGWQPAHRVARCTAGHWSALDEAALAAVIQALLSTSAEPVDLDVDRACALFGIGVLPIDDDGAIVDWPAMPTVAVAQQLIAHWRRDLHPLFGLVSCRPACEQLRTAPWLSPEVVTDPGLEIKPGVGPGAPYAAQSLWLQTVSGGFQTTLLPRLVVPRDRTPLWATDMEVRSPAAEQAEAGRTARIEDALSRLAGAPEALQHERDLSDLYRRLVSPLLALDAPPAIPLLYRPIDAQGRAGGLAWGDASSGIWHDPGGIDSSALSAFRDVKVWVYRGASAKAAAALHLIHFEAGVPEVKQEGESKPARAQALRDAIWQALPDLLAAAALEREAFDEPEAIRRQAALEVCHFEHVWLRWTFQGKAAERGRNEQGDVFLAQQFGRAPAIYFDGEQPLVECAFPLSELLCDSRAFGAVFRDGLYAWSRALGQETADSVSRFRRDHNLTEADVAQWRVKLEEVRLEGALRDRWRAAVGAVLERYGELAETVGLGMIVTPRTWSGFSEVGGGLTAFALAAELARALETEPRLQRLVPRVEFAQHHRHVLQQASRIPYIAAAAHARPAAEWTEHLLETLTALGEGVTDEETKQLDRLCFDADHVLRIRYGLSTEGPLSTDEAALAFARGQIPIRALPTATTTPVSLRRFTTTQGDGEAAREPRAALDEEAWLARSRRRASGGRRAEEAVLDHALQQAMSWRSRDPKGWATAVGQVLPLLGATGRERWQATEDAEPGAAAEPLRAFLHVSDYLGDVGFDLLVPAAEAGTLQMVEVKRVGALDADAVFFLSENERRKAIRYLTEQRPWRLWLVSSAGRVKDVSALAVRLRDLDPHVAQLLEAGLRPGEWMLAVI